jgi:hypothetical protein
VFEYNETCLSWTSLEPTFVFRVDRSSVNTGSTFVFRIDRSSVYTGWINKCFLLLDFYFKFSLYRVPFYSGLNLDRFIIMPIISNVRQKIFLYSDSAIKDSVYQYYICIVFINIIFVLMQCIIFRDMSSWQFKDAGGCGKYCCVGADWWNVHSS